MNKKGATDTRQRNSYIAGSIALLLLFLFVVLFHWTAPMAARSYPADMLTLSDQENEISSNLRDHVFMLAGEIGERNIWLPQKLDAAAAFTNEEPPFFLGRDMGSMVYASLCRKRKKNIVGMLSLETMGYYSEAPDSQEYPSPFSFFYPHTANFIGFVGNIRSFRLVRLCLAAFRNTSEFPSEGTAAPGWITGIGLFNMENH